MVKKENKKTWINLLAGIKHYVETNEPVNQGTALDTTPVKEIA